jgi:hypothetical protein
MGTYISVRLLDGFFSIFLVSGYIIGSRYDAISAISAYIKPGVYLYYTNARV